MKHRLRFLYPAPFVLAAALAAPSAHPSGSISFDAGASGTAQSYNEGKRIASTALLCSSCPLAGQKLDKALAGRVLAEAPLTAPLDADQRSALATYLRRRFDL